MRRQTLVRMNAGATGGCARLLADGKEMPVLRLAVWQVPHGASELLGPVARVASAYVTAVRTTAASRCRRIAWREVAGSIPRL
jgi:hypothetical protein